MKLVETVMPKPALVCLGVGANVLDKLNKSSFDNLTILLDLYENYLKTRYLTENEILHIESKLKCRGFEQINLRADFVWVNQEPHTEIIRIVKCNIYHLYVGVKENCSCTKHQNFYANVILPATLLILKENGNIKTELDNLFENSFNKHHLNKSCFTKIHILEKTYKLVHLEKVIRCFEPFTFYE